MDKKFRLQILGRYEVTNIQMLIPQITISNESGIPDLRIDQLLFPFAMIRESQLIYQNRRVKFCLINRQTFSSTN